MQTQVIHVDPSWPAERLDAYLQPAAAALAAGQLVAFPTETVYGLGGDALDPAAIAAIFAVKGRPADNPLIVHVARPADLRPLTASCPPLAEALLAAFAPGPLTLILPKADAVPAVVTAGLQTIAVRIPAHPVARRLIELAGVPVAAPSANRSGRPSPTRGWHVIEDLDGAIPYIIDAGDCEYGLESTVVDLTGPVPEILRPGAITAEQIRSVAGDVTGIGTRQPVHAVHPDKPRSPGMKYRHYAPRAELRIITGHSLAERARTMAGMLAKARDLTTAGRRIGLYGCGQLLQPLPGQDPVSEPAGPLQREVVAEPANPMLQGTTLEPLRFYEISPGQPIAELRHIATLLPADAVCLLAYAGLPDPVAAARHLFDALRSFDALDVALILAEGLPDRGGGTAYMNRLHKAAGGGEVVPGNQGSGTAARQE